MHQDADLIAQKCVGTLQFFITQQQALDALGDLVDLGLVRHGMKIVGFGETGSVESGSLVLAVWFTRRSSTGSRRKSRPAEGLTPLRAAPIQLTCAAPATVNGRVFFQSSVEKTFRFHH